jgi:hypothetical protein
MANMENTSGQTMAIDWYTFALQIIELLKTQYFCVRKYICTLEEPSKNVNSLTEYTIMRGGSSK